MHIAISLNIVVSTKELFLWHKGPERECQQIMYTYNYNFLKNMCEYIFLFNKLNMSNCTNCTFLGHCGIIEGTIFMGQREYLKSMRVYTYVLKGRREAVFSVCEADISPIA